MNDDIDEQSYHEYANEYAPKIMLKLVQNVLAHTSALKSKYIRAIINSFMTRLP